MDDSQKSPNPAWVEPVPEKLMEFPEAIREVINGNKITKKEWNNDDYGCLQDGELIINRNGRDNWWRLNDGDLLGDDWVVVRKDRK